MRFGCKKGAELVQPAQARKSRLSEITRICGSFKLAQVRRTSLSEVEGLAWATGP